MNAFRSGIAIHKSIKNSETFYQVQNKWNQDINELQTFLMASAHFKHGKRHRCCHFFSTCSSTSGERQTSMPLMNWLCRLAHLFPLATKILLKLIAAWFHWSIDSMFCLLSTNVQKDILNTDCLNWNISWHHEYNCIILLTLKGQQTYNMNSAKIE